jgi:hypothetical protein
MPCFVLDRHLLKFSAQLYYWTLITRDFYWRFFILIGFLLNVFFVKQLWRCALLASSYSKRPMLVFLSRGTSWRISVKEVGVSLTIEEPRTENLEILCIFCVCITYKALLFQKKDSGLLEPEFQAVGSHLTWVLGTERISFKSSMRP